MEYFLNSDGKKILSEMIRSIQKNKDYLSEVDGRIGDGDHGMNMNKGFTVFGDRISESNVNFSDGLSQLGEILLNEIGGSMGPIYGTIFIGMSDCCSGHQKIDLPLFAKMLRCGLNELCEIIDAKVGDKTILDTLIPAVESVEQSVHENESFSQAMTKMISAADKGKESTKELVAKFGRSSRLGERSKGVLDAGVVSCFLILESMGTKIRELCD